MSNASKSPLVGIVMGSKSDWPTMKAAADILSELEISHEVRVVSAHRMPDAMAEYGKEAAGRGLKVVVAGAGGAAHLPGMIAAQTTLPVVGVPVKSSSLSGLDSLLSIVQMPSGVPVATVAIGGAANAGILAAQIVGTFDEEVSKRLVDYKLSLRRRAESHNEAIGSE